MKLAALALAAFCAGCASLPPPRRLDLAAAPAPSLEQRQLQLESERVTYEDGLLRRDGREISLDVFRQRLHAQGDLDAERLVSTRWSAIPLAAIKVLTGALIGTVPLNNEVPGTFNAGRIALGVSIFGLWGAYDVWQGFHPKVEEACRLNEQNLRYSLGLPEDKIDRPQ